MEYLDMVEIHEDMASYIEENYSGATVLTCFPQINELTLEYGGYVTESLDVVGRKPLIAISNGTFNENVRVEGSEEYVWYYEDVDYSSIDLVYYSEQQYDCPYWDEVNAEYELVEVKSFEKNGKRVVLYSVAEVL